MSDSRSERPDLWARVWLVLASDRMLIAWLGLLALAGLVTLWFPQAPRSAYVAEQGLERWLTGVRAELGSPTDLLLAAGFLAVERSVWFRILLAGTALSLLLRTVDSLTWVIGPGRRISEPCLVQTVTLRAQARTVLDRVREKLGADLSAVERQESGEYRLTVKRRLAPLGPLCMSLGGLLIIAGWIWTQVGGWQETDLFLTDQGSSPATFIAGILALEDFEVQWRGGATAGSAEGVLRLAGDQGTAIGEISLDSPWHREGTTYRLTGVGPAVYVTGRGPGGAPLLLQTAASRPPAEQITLALPADNNLRSFAAPEQGITVQVEALAGENRPEIRMRVYLGQAGELVKDHVMTDQASILVGGSELSVSMIPFAEITATHAPGRLFGIGGAILVVAGAVLALLYPRQDIQVVAKEEGDKTVVMLGLSGRGADQWLLTLSQQLASNGSEDDES